MSDFPRDVMLDFMLAVMLAVIYDLKNIISNFSCNQSYFFYFTPVDIYI